MRLGTFDPRLLAFWLAIMAASMPAPAANSLDGITVLKLRDAGAAQVISGHGGGSYAYLSVYISGEGTYAALGNKSSRSCIAWAQEGSYTGASIIFGSPPTEQSVERFPSICQPFTLSLEEDGAVRVSAENAVGSAGPLSPNAQMVRYNRRQEVIARAPLMAVDWSNPHYERFAMSGVRLGPLPAVRAGLEAGATVQLGPLQVKYDGARKHLAIQQTPGDRDDSRQIAGDVADAAFIGWPWDAFFGGKRVARLPEPSTVAAFDSSLHSRFGKPTLVETTGNSSRRDHYWLFDLGGSQLDAGSGGPDTCRETMDIWSELKPLWRVKSDVGPWACSLVVLIKDNATVKGTVSGYEMSAVSGYTAALNHFKWRMGELREIRAQSDAVLQREVQL